MIQCPLSMVLTARFKHTNVALVLSTSYGSTVGAMNIGPVDADYIILAEDSATLRQLWHKSIVDSRLKRVLFEVFVPTFSCTPTFF